MKKLLVLLVLSLSPVLAYSNQCNSLVSNPDVTVTSSLEMSAITNSGCTVSGMTLTASNGYTLTQIDKNRILCKQTGASGGGVIVICDGCNDTCVMPKISTHVAYCGSSSCQAEQFCDVSFSIAH